LEVADVASGWVVPCISRQSYLRFWYNTSLIPSIAVPLCVSVSSDFFLRLLIQISDFLSGHGPYLNKQTPRTMERVGHMPSESRSAEIQAILFTFSILSVASVALRSYVRARILRSFSYDDACAAVALVLALGTAIAIAYGRWTADAWGVNC
jgi:hypothetical protein